MSEQHLHVSGESHDNEIRTLIGTDSGTSSSGSEEAEECKPVKYEYKTVRVREVSADYMMDDWYAKGWEPMFAVATGEFSEMLVFTLRRPVDN